MISAFIELIKPRITALVLLTTGVGLYMAPGSMTPGTVSPGRIFLSLLGTVLMVAGANVMNMYLERDSDALMKRTQHRPLPARRMKPPTAFWFGTALAVASVLILFTGVNVATGLLAVLSFVVYVMLYTPLKKRSSTALQIGGVSGAMPPVIGWAAVTGSVELPAVILFAIMFLWQVPHFLALALFLQGDYAQAGIKVYPLERGEQAARMAMVRYTLALVLVSLFPYLLHMAGIGYLLTALFLGLVFAGYGLYGLKSGSPEWGHRLFLLSLVYLVVLFSALVLDKV